MIISHKNKFIFLKTNKTAGTSIEIALSKFCDHKDIITPITYEDEKIRNKFGFYGPQNYLLPISEYKFKDILKFLIKLKRKKKFYNHISALEIKELVSFEVWKKYLKFCVERNPWDRAISLYYNLYEKEPRPSIAEFVNSDSLLILKKRGFNLYTIGGQIVVDKICRFENLSEDLEEIRRALELPEKLDLPRAKSRFRKDHRSYRDLLGKKEKKRIFELFSHEIRLMGYKY